MSAVRPAWPLVLLVAAACFADNPPDLGGPGGLDTTGGAASTTDATDATAGTTVTTVTTATDTGVVEDCLPGMSPTPWYIDQDGDDWGVEPPVMACMRPDGHADRPGDCDDGAIGINPDAIELCNERDDDCDALIDEYSLANEACEACRQREHAGAPWWLCGEDSVDWKTAHDRCQAFGAELASVRSEGENSWLVGEIADMGFDPAMIDTTLWLGMRRTDDVAASCETTPDAWKWIDGAPVDYLAWAPGQPDNVPAMGGCNAMCVPNGIDDASCPRENCLDLIGLGGWNDVQCNLKGQGFVCRGPASAGP